MASPEPSPAAGPSGAESMDQDINASQDSSEDQPSTALRPVQVVIPPVERIDYIQDGSTYSMFAVPDFTRPLVDEGFVHPSSADSVVGIMVLPTIERISSAYEAYLVVRCRSYTSEKPLYSLSNCYLDKAKAKDLWNRAIATAQLNNPRLELEYYMEETDGQTAVMWPEATHDSYLEVRFPRWKEQAYGEYLEDVAVVLRVMVPKGSPRASADVSIEGCFGQMGTAYLTAKAMAEQLGMLEERRQQVYAIIYGKPEYWSFETRLWMGNPVDEPMLYVWYDVVPCGKVYAQ
ncbi:hypothetical protein K491DRAFT_680804 [Lophiostoma macrostomum CBS 122681]|uniref:Uncharacterized protein n=1 Tax=Lophiostoma macrostomum CBS 122681 TaxID=1314788 RepID=A0A6A6T066_9PLEO|nr:hypothetical protein K491DRAFT_680804 [Lophiostoma macrostomum CBS 122681]